MDVSFLTFSPPKRNSRIPKLDCKRRKSKSPVTSPKNWQAVHKANVAQKMATSSSSKELHDGCRTQSKHTSRGKENREKVTSRNFPNRQTSKLSSSKKNNSKRVLFKPCRKMNCSVPNKDGSSNSSITMNDHSSANTSDVSSLAKKANGETVNQKKSYLASSIEISDDGVVVVSDTSCSDIREALKLMSVCEMRETVGDSSVCIVSESASSSVCVVKEVCSGDVNLGSDENIIADTSNIVLNTSSSDLSDMKTQLRFPVRRNNIFCTEPRTKNNRIRTISRQLDSVLVGNKMNVIGVSNCVDNVLVGNEENSNVSNSLNGRSNDGKHITARYQSENMKLKGKSRPPKPYKASLQNSFRQSLLCGVYNSGAKVGFWDKKGEDDPKNKFLMERNLQSDTSKKLGDKPVLSSKHDDNVLAPSSDCQFGIEHHDPVAVSTPVLSLTKYREVENWLNANDFNNARASLSDSRTENFSSEVGCVGTTPNRSNDFLSVSTVDVLNSVYGSNWYSGDVNKKCYTEPVQRRASYKDSESSEIKYMKTNGQTKRSTSSSSGGEDNLSEFLKHMYCSGKQNRKPPRQLLHTPDFIDDNSVEDSPTQYLKSQSNDVKTDVKITHQVFQEKSGGASNNNFDLGNCAQQLCFSTTDSGSSERSVHTHTKKTSKDVKKNKKIAVVKENESKKFAVVTPLVRKEQKVCTRRTSFHAESTLSFLASLSAPTPDGKCDSEARYFKKNFTKLKEALGKKLFQLYNEKVFENKLPHDMPLQWNVRMRQTAGYCYSKRTLSSTGEKIRTSRIVLSTKVIATPDRLRDTLIHEMCHAAAWILDMVKDGHGPRWKAWAKKATNVFPDLPPIRRCHDYNIHTKFTYRCMGCGYSFGRHSKSLNLTAKRCGYCFGEFELLVNTKNKAGVVVQAAKPHRSPRGFARFVKDNYNTIKKTRPGLKHGDIMKLLSEQFKTKHQRAASR